VTRPLAERSPGGSASGSATLERALDRTSDARAIPGNAVRHLPDGPETFAAMLAIIDAAREWLHFENYIIRDDCTGRVFAERLKAAAARGVTVRLLYDPWGCRGTPRRYFRTLRAAGVQSRAFNPVRLWHPITAMQRDHRKYCAADGARAVLGGICIGDEWAGFPERGIPPWRDTAVEIHGPALPALESSFLRRWEEAGGAADLATPTRSEPQGTARVRVVDGVPGTLRVYRTMELLVAAACDRIWVTDAYMVAPAPLVASLIAAARSGADVRILLPGHTDLPAVRALTRVGYRELLEAGARIWEWHGPMLHAKTVVVDDRWVKVGSTNLNPSSLIANYELDVLIEDVEVTQAAAQQFRRDLSNAVEVVLRPRRFAARLPPKVARAADPAEPGPRRRVRELPSRAAVALRQVAGGARRSIAGAVIFLSVGAGALFLALPRVMAYALAVISFSLAAGAASQFLQRRHRQR